MVTYIFNRLPVSSVGDSRRDFRSSVSSDVRGIGR